ncbi:MAG: Ca2+-dependent phosphoinositide-specific phospholipase C [Candidatus Hydrogenedentota bacterium]
MIRLHAMLFSVLLLLPSSFAAAQQATIYNAPVDTLRMNQIQVIGTHNSYHQRPPDAIMKLAYAINPKASAWDYSHAPLDVQLERGVRSFELDIHYTADGFRVFHAPLDMGTSCERLIECMTTVRAWSAANPDHVPISFLLEGKTEALLLDPDIFPLDAEGLDVLDSEIRSVFDEDMLITPDVIRGGSPTLESAVLERGWPLLDDVRGMVMFILHERGRERDLYAKNRPSLEGRAMFVNSSRGRPDAAVIVHDRPDPDSIAKLVRQGYYVRTRADTNIRAAPDRLSRALRSGAHIITTDFPPGEADKDSGYVVRFEGEAPARLNPVNRPVTE